MTRTISSQTSNAKYFFQINPETGEAECGCPDHAKWAPNRVGGCKHMKSFQSALRQAEVFNQLWQALDVRSQAQRDARATARISMELALGW